MNADNQRPVSRDEILNAAILLREDNDEWELRIAAGVVGRVRRRKRRNMALAAVLTFVLGAGIGLSVYDESQQDYAAEDPYLTLYDSIYAQSNPYPEIELE